MPPISPSTRFSSFAGKTFECRLLLVMPNQDALVSVFITAYLLPAWKEAFMYYFRDKLIGKFSTSLDHLLRGTGPINSYKVVFSSLFLACCTCYRMNY